jgi:hypothetical protein
VPSHATFIRTPEEITSDWLGAVLGRARLEVTGTVPIGTGQMSQNHRVTFTVGGGRPETVVVKLASDDPTSRATGVGLGLYLREVSLYRHLAARLDGPLPACHFAEYDEAEGWFTLVLEDIIGAEQGDQIAGCSVEEARIALRELGRLHAPVLGDFALAAADYLNQANPTDQIVVAQLLAGFLERYADRVAPEHVAVCKRFVGVFDAWMADLRPPLGLVHGDYRLDNLLFGNDTCKVVDWQTVSWGPAMRDAAYFIGGSLSVGNRRAHEQELFRLYYDELLARGVQDLSWEQCWEEYRRQTFYGIFMTVAASMLVVRTERGDEMFMTWLERNAQQVLDLDALSLLPDASAERPPALQPAPEDEGCHAPGPEPLWNESWYFDGVSDAGDLGVYTRIGRLPNQDSCLYTACICGPGRPSIMLVDSNAPLPAIDDDTQAIDIAGLRAEHHCEEPLRRLRATLQGTAQAHTDASAPLRGEQGEPVDVAFDLVWETDGVPYAWRQSTRYEIPCRVTGAVRIGEEEIAFTGSGQRDHSWGPRDWWAVDWMWSALHLEDGTRTHAVGVPQMPGYGVGYVQKDGELAEIESVHASAEVAGNGLFTSTTIVSSPDELKIDVEPVAYGAILLEAPDGRVSHFPRAMCRARTGDGRAGTGWVEWNRNQRANK